MKANSNQAVLRTVASLGGGFDIVSEGELRRAMAAGGAPGKCVFARRQPPRRLNSRSGAAFILSMWKARRNLRASTASPPV